MAVIKDEQVAGLSNPDKRERLLFDLVQADSLTYNTGWQVETHAYLITDPKDRAAALSVAAVAYWHADYIALSLVTALKAREADPKNVLSGLVVGALRVGLPSEAFTGQISSMAESLTAGHPQVFAA